MNIEMDTEWKNDFLPHILARGKKYFEEGRVGPIQRCGNTIIATVEGTEDYTVEIDVEDNNLGHMECDCPYAADSEQYCKHMAAVLYALEWEDVAIEEIPPGKQPPIVSHIPMETPWLEAIERLPEKVVRKELMKLADQDAYLKERLAVLYLGKLSEGQIQNWKADLQKTALGYTNRTGRINYEYSWEFLNDLSNFLNEKLPLLLEVKAVTDAFYLIWIVMETALEWEMDDDYAELDDLLMECKDAYEALLPLATDAQREQMLQWYEEHRNEDWPGGVERMDFIFYPPVPPEISTGDKRIVKYLNDIPCFLHEGEWVSFPVKNGIYYDFVETTAAYREAIPVIEEIIKENLGDLYGCFGSCHAIWHQRKQLLREKYGIEWFSPTELNRAVRFD